ncbi:MAG: hypothetical protein WCC10_02115, partial [Tumebacillaceae bacterium]
LTVWHQITDPELELLVGRDLIIQQNNGHAFFIKEAQLDQILSKLDNKSKIIDLSDSNLEVNYIPRSKRKENIIDPNLKDGPA